MRCFWLFVLIGCSTPEQPDAPEIEDDGSWTRIVEGTAVAMGVLGLLNHPGTTEAVLDDEVGLDVRAARALIEHRDGRDGEFGTRDDDLYDSIAEVDAQHYVGDSAISKLTAYAASNGWVPGEGDVVGSWEGVTFTTSQVTGVLAVVNDATQQVLDEKVGLDRRAAEGIVEARPIGSIDTLAEISYVGPAALRDLQAYAADFVVGSVGDDCETHDDCAADLRCAGSVAWGYGISCVDTWGVFSWSGPAAIPDDGTELATSVEVGGLASVPIDVVLTIDIEHERPSDLELSIDNFNGYGTSLWDGGDDDPDLTLVVYAFPSDDAVNGTYTVRVTDTAAGAQGTLRGWDLEVVSIYD